MLRILVILLALAGASSVVAVTRHQGEEHFLGTRHYEDLYYLPSPDWLSVFSLGHRAAVADLIWLRALIYFGEELGERGDVSNLHNYAEAMLTLDPHFKRVYLWASTCALYRTGTVTAADARKAIAYLERAVRLFPDDGELAWNLGANYAYELPPLLTDQAEVEEAKRRGAENLQVAARLGAGPPWLVLTTASTLAKLGQNEKLIAHLQDVYAQIDEPEVKEQIEIRLAQLRSDAFAEGFRHANEELELARKRDFPYIDHELHILLGARPPFDGRAQALRNFDPSPDQFVTDEAD